MTTRVAFVTGGTRGIGKAISARLKADGMKVAAGYSGNDAAADATAKELGIMVVKGNVGNFDDCVKAAKAVEEQLGPIDVLVNNAGITRDVPFHKMSLDQWNAVISTNLKGTFLNTQRVARRMVEAGKGGAHRKLHHLHVAGGQL